MKTSIALIAVALALVTPPARADIYTSVATLNGKLVPGLQASDFEVLEDGQPRPIVNFSAAPNPLRVVVVADTSGSMWLPDDLGSLLESFVPNIRLADRTSFVRFGPSVSVAAPFSPDPLEVQRAAGLSWGLRRPLDGPSPLWDALDAAIAALERQEGRRVIVLLTDGRATGNTIAFDAVLRRAVAANVEIDAMITGMPARDREPKRGALLFPWERPRQLVELTGGLLLGGDSDNARTAKSWLSGLVESARSEYRLEIEPRADGRAHTIEVRMPKPGLVIRARRLLAAPPG